MSCGKSLLPETLPSPLNFHISLGNSLGAYQPVNAKFGSLHLRCSKKLETKSLTTIIGNQLNENLSQEIIFLATNLAVTKMLETVTENLDS